MNKKLIAGLCCWSLSGFALPVLAADTDPQQCLECHEPIEDWAGMTVDEIIVEAKNPENKRHEGNEALTDEQLRLMIGVLMPPK
ncbi:MAG: hypothetical protein KDI17_09965 [Halioglobus sp.]|nr:hypothetical protein [Halioglobus sp.]